MSPPAISRVTFESPPPYHSITTSTRPAPPTTSPSSSSSSSSSTNTTTTEPYTDLHARALALLDLLCNKHDLASASDYLHPNMIVTHDDNPPVYSRAAFLAGWEKALTRMPDFRAEVCEACVDERQRKVWVCSEISFGGSDSEDSEGEKGSKRGPVRKESVDMLVFDEQGRVVSSADCQRVVSRRRRERRATVEQDEY